MIGEVICAEEAFSCVCALPPGHAGPHECGRDGGQWTGNHGGDDFAVVRFPGEDGAS